MQGNPGLGYPQVGKRSGKGLTVLARFAIGLFLISWFLVFTATVGFSFINQPAQVSGDVLPAIVHVAPGMDSKEIGEMLHSKQLISSPEYFNFLAGIFGLADSLQAGYYRLSPDMTLMEIITQLQKGRILTYEVTIPEGLQAREIADLLAAKGLVDRDRFLDLVRDERLIYGSNPPIEKPIPSLEGYLYPDTYIIAKGQSEEMVIRRMVARFQEVVVPYIQQHNQTQFSMHEILTLASIIEEEAMIDRERPVISAVFHNRLRISMPLQSCPTVQYALGIHRQQLLYEDLQVDSPYNTYKYRGLPPGPISNPGLKSIWAAINPAEVDYKFFVARGDGSHIFSRTFQEHVAARRRLGI